MSATNSDDFLPAPRSPGRLARRRSQQLRRWWIAGGAIGAVALIVLVSVVVFGSDHGSGAGARRAGHGSTHRTTTTTRKRTSTTSTTGDSTSSTPTTSSVVDSVPGGGGTTSPTDGPNTDPNFGLSVTEDPGACQWLADTGEMVDSGTLHNSGTEAAVAEVEVTWSDSTGELDSYTDLETVPPRGSAPWSVSDNFVDTPPQGLTCQIALI
jgi:hypothetical protein